MPTPLTDADKVLRNDTGKDIVTALSKMSTLNTKQITNTPIASFTDGADNIPVKSLESEIVAVETGNGQPKSPDNPYIISGFDSGIITRCGKNLFNFSPTTVTSSRTIASDIFLKAGNYVCSFFIKNTTAISGYFQVRIGTTSIGGVNFAANYQGIVRKAFILSEDSTINIFVGGASAGYNFEFSNGQIELGTTSTTFEAYNGNTYTFAFGQTVYGGYFDNKGNLVVTKAIINLGSLDWTYHVPSGDVGAFFDTFLPSNSIIGNRDIAFDGNIGIYNIIPSKDIALSGYDNNVCALANATRRFITCDQRFTDATSYKTAMNGVMLAYPLVNSVVLPITSQDIPTLLGENNIFSNCGDINTLVYYPQGQDAVVSLNSIANGVLGIADVLTEGLDNIAEAVSPRAATEIPIESGSATNTKDYIDSGLSGKANAFTKKYVQTTSATSVSANTIDTQTFAVNDAQFGIICGVAITNTTNFAIVQCVFWDNSNITLRVRNVTNATDSYQATIYYI